MITLTNGYTVKGETFSVSEEYGSEFPEWKSESDWFEYRLWLQKPNSDTVDDWISLFETYNGMRNQRLSQFEAEEALREAFSRFGEDEEQACHDYFSDTFGEAAETQEVAH